MQMKKKVYLGSLSFSTTQLLPGNGEGKEDERVGGEREGKASGKTFKGGGPSLLVVSGQGVRLAIAFSSHKLACFFGQTVPGRLWVRSGCASPKYLQPAIVRSNQQKNSNSI